MNKPIELQNAIEAVETCWDRYDKAIEAGDNTTARALWLAVDILEGNQLSQYKQWQILGGTSDIESIALAGVGLYSEPVQLVHRTDERNPVYDVTANFNGIKATASKTWVERHLNNGGK